MSDLDTNKVFVFAGEHSGDVYGGALLREIKRLRPQLELFGVGGPLMREQGLDCVLPMEEFQIMGFVDVFKKLPTIFRQLRQLRDTIMEAQPAATVLIDYPGFNLRLARALRKKGYQGKIIHYVCPTVWAWGHGRIKTMAANLDLLLTIFPFEPPLFKETPLTAQFVGHPLIERLSTYSYNNGWAREVGLEGSDNILALFPGSRRGEISLLIDRELIAAKRLQDDHPDLIIAVSCAGDHVQPMIEEAIRKAGLTLGKDAFLVPRKYAYELMRDCRSVVAKSGTVNLEIALHHKPCVVVYEVSLVNYLILWYFIRLHMPHYSIVNILLGRRLYPELMTEKFSEDDIYKALAPLHRDGPERDACIAGCREAHEALQTADHRQPSAEAARAVMELFPTQEKSTVDHVGSPATL